MGFTGGNTGAFSLPNHKHTNAALDGGEFDELVSLINGITFKAWKDSTTKLKLLERHDAAIAEASHTFTPAAEITIDEASKILLLIAGESTGALDLQLQLNGNVGATDYKRWGQRYTNTPTQVLSFASAAFYSIADANLIAGANQQFTALIEIVPTPPESNSSVSIYSKATGPSPQMSQIGQGFCSGGGMTGVDAIKILTSANTWKADTSISIYEVLQ